MAAQLHAHVAVMGSGKSTIALQHAFNLERGGYRGMLVTMHDRDGAVISSRIGISHAAVAIDESTDLFAIIAAEHAREPLNFVICDEVQFYTPLQIEQLADVVDTLGIDVQAFGLLVDFRSQMFPGTKRLLELSDRRLEMPVQPRCWCGNVATQNARTVAGVMTLDGEQVLVGDTRDAPVAYELLCRRHYRLRETASTAKAAHATA